MYTLLEVIYCMIDFWYLDIFTHIFEKGDKIRRKVTKAAIIVIFALITYGCTSIKLYTNLSNLLVLVLMIIYNSIVFEGKVRNKIIITVIYNVLLGGGTSVILNLVSGLTMTSVSVLLRFGTIQRIVVVCSVKLILLGAIKGIEYLISSLDLNMPIKYRYIMLGIFMTSYVSIGCIFELSLDNQNLIFYKTICLILVSFIGCNVAILFLIKRVSQYLEEQTISDIVSSNQVNLRKSILEIEEKQKEIYKIKHDLLNHYEILEYLIKSDNIDEGLQYIGQLKSGLKNTGTYYKTGNAIADAVINQKVELGMKEKIKYDIKIHIPKELPIKAIDLGAILFNLLDNAIEAVREVEEEKRKIKINIHPHHESLIINTSNTVAYNPINEGKLIRRKKEHYNEHGYGMRSIKHVVAQYDGYLNYKCEQDMFESTILLKYKSNR